VSFDEVVAREGCTFPAVGVGTTFTPVPCNHSITLK
jgi:hypothetical protein